MTGGALASGQCPQVEQLWLLQEWQLEPEEDEAPGSAERVPEKAKVGNFFVTFCEAHLGHSGRSSARRISSSNSWRHFSQ